MMLKMNWRWKLLLTLCAITTASMFVCMILVARTRFTEVKEDLVKHENASEAPNSLEIDREKLAGMEFKSFEVVILMDMTSPQGVDFVEQNFGKLTSLITSSSSVSKASMMVSGVRDDGEKVQIK